VTRSPLPRLGTTRHARLVARYRRAWERSIRAEERADTIEQAWRLAARSDAALRALRLVEAGGDPRPVLRETARSRALSGLVALASLGRVVARALQAESALRAARRVLRLRRLARLRRALRTVVRRALRPLACVVAVAVAILASLVASCVPRALDTS